jgi:hypothetical protein
VGASEICCGDTIHTGDCCDSSDCAGGQECTDHLCTDSSDCETDGDGDGHYDASCGGDDCNDADASIHPGAAEVCDDHADNDCDGLEDGEDQETCGGKAVNGGCSCGTERSDGPAAGLLIVLSVLLLLFRSRSRLVITALLMGTAFIVASCAGNGSEILPVEDYMPKDGYVEGWVEDTGMGDPGVEAAHTKEEAEALINGAIDPFESTGGWVALAIEYYKNDRDPSQTLELMLLEMQTASHAMVVYEDPGLTMGVTWDPLSVGDVGRTLSAGPHWVIHVVYHNYFLKVSRATPGDEAGLSAAESFLEAVVAGLP